MPFAQPVSSLSLLLPRAAKSVVTGTEISPSRVQSAMWILSGLCCFCLAPYSPFLTWPPHFPISALTWRVNDCQAKESHFAEQLGGKPREGRPSQ